MVVATLQAEMLAMVSPPPAKRRSRTFDGPHALLGCAHDAVAAQAWAVGSSGSGLRSTPWWASRSKRRRRDDSTIFAHIWTHFAPRASPARCAENASCPLDGRPAAFAGKLLYMAIGTKNAGADQTSGFDWVEARALAMHSRTAPIGESSIFLVRA